MAQTAVHRDNELARSPIEAIRCGPTIGAEVRGVDFSRPVPRQVATAIHDALMRYKVIFFRGAEMTPAQHVAFAKLFGEPTVYPFVPHLDGHPEVVVLDNHKDNPVFSTDVWHSDETFRLVPPMGSILRCIRRRRRGALRSCSGRGLRLLCYRDSRHCGQHRHKHDKRPLHWVILPLRAVNRLLPFCLICLRLQPFCLEYPIVSPRGALRKRHGIDFLCGSRHAPTINSRANRKN